MKFRSAMMVVLSLLFVLVGAESAVAGDQDFQLFNRTGVDIYAVYVSPTGTEEWEEDILGADILLAGADIEIAFDRDEDDEFWDIRVEDQEGNFLYWEEINLYTVYQVILEPDGTARVKE